MAVSIQEIQFDLLEKVKYPIIKRVFNTIHLIDKNDNICIGAFYKSDLIGFVCAEQYKKGKYRILYLEVLPLFRDFGIGSKLLSNFVSFCKSKKGIYIYGRYNDENHSEKLSERFYVNNNWTKPRYDYTHYRLPRDLFYTKFVKRFYCNDFELNSSDLSFVFLDQLNETEINNIKEKTRESIPDFLLPFNGSINELSSLSIFVFKGVDIVAWCIMKEVNSQEIYAKSTYVRDDYRSSALGLTLWNMIYQKAEKLNSYSMFKWISLEFDKKDKRLWLLYKKLFHSFLDKDTDYYIVSNHI